VARDRRQGYGSDQRSRLPYQVPPRQNRVSDFIDLLDHPINYRPSVSSISFGIARYPFRYSRMSRLISGFCSTGIAQHQERVVAGSSSDHPSHPHQLQTKIPLDSTRHCTLTGYAIVPRKSSHSRLISQILEVAWRHMQLSFVIIGNKGARRDQIQRRGDPAPE
jgi:hypothetical protein